MLNEDNAAYLRYTGPQRIDRAMHTLEGLVTGIAIDSKINDKELSALTGWIGSHREYANRHPFNEVIGRLNEILADGIVDDEEKADILWLCNKFSTENSFFSEVSSDMQRLQGILGGIAADGKITVEELENLNEWLYAHEHLKTCWPYDELEALIIAVLKDGVIDDDEHKALMAFFREFTDRPGHKAVALPANNGDSLIGGVCAVCPEIQFLKQNFCFTGRSTRMTRDELAQQVADFGGLFSRGLTQTVNYLIVGADGNPCWAYACYGRKVEQAMSFRKKGLPLVIVHENDYWDAVSDYT
jgi:hypothetical protein